MSYNVEAQLSSRLIAEMPQELRPREKAINYGVKTLTDAELMALLFATGIKGKGVVAMCEDILADNEGHISHLTHMQIDDVISRYKGIGQAKALTLLAALELGARSAADAIAVRDTQITTADVAYEYMKPKLFDLDHEEFWILMLKQNNTIIRPQLVGRGGFSMTAVDVKVILREALLAKSPSIMLFHNHPSGALTPSAQDIALTRKIVDAAKILDIRVLDHIIVSYKGYYSFVNEGRMP